MKVNRKQNWHSRNGPGSYKMLFLVPTPKSCRSEDLLTTALYQHCSVQGKSQHNLYIIVIVRMAMTSFLSGGILTKLANYNLLTS